MASQLPTDHKIPGPPFCRLSNLRSRYISPNVHKALVSHFSLYPASAFKGKRKNGGVADGFFQFYKHCLCYYPNQQYDGGNPPATTIFPPQLRGLVEECLLFYINALFPYFSEQLGKPWYDFDDSYDPRLTFINILDAFGGLVDRRIGIVISQRWRNGLLRDGQVQLLIILCRKMLVQLWALVCIPAEEVNEEFLRVAEIMRAMERTWKAICKFFGNERFRSERLENLLLRYLDEEEVNWDVVRGMEKAQRVKEKGTAPRSRTLMFFWRKSEQRMVTSEAEIADGSPN
ncbi:hypothetical protein BJ508DRAFT_331785 [Ascobolus immersus RN42]|uniref:Uncharacterized protein n=1 Tax=Ascobolus immersus RN42 TaxID=1160509 RepID=A0A3N4HS09_ASCIM|nr:hypothetical protein BJ508DRAFT_331785 [Ascobolus immersus RN42]